VTSALARCADRLMHGEKLEEACDENSILYLVKQTMIVNIKGFYAGIPDVSVCWNYPRLSSFMPSARSWPSGGICKYRVLRANRTKMYS